MHERQLRSSSVDFRFFLRDVGDRRYAERSAELTEKDQEQRTLLAQRSQHRSVLRGGLIERLSDRRCGRGFRHKFSLVFHHGGTKDTEK
jgi:hypothetical protein